MDKKKHSFFNKDVKPQMNINEGSILKLFGMIPSGDIDKIAKFISNYNLTYNIKNKEKESALHKVLETPNSILKKDKKTKLVKFFLENNAPADSFTKLHITPLHLACKYNIYNITKMLINYGAYVDAVDGNNTTPLHYLLHGNIGDCIVENKVIDMIQPDENVTPTRKDIKEITKIIIELVKQKNVLPIIHDTIMNIKPQVELNYELNGELTRTGLYEIIKEKKKLAVADVSQQYETNQMEQGDSYNIADIFDEIKKELNDTITNIQKQINKIHHIFNTLYNNHSHAFVEYLVKLNNNIYKNKVDNYESNFVDIDFKVEDLYTPLDILTNGINIENTYIVYYALIRLLKCKKLINDYIDVVLLSSTYDIYNNVGFILVEIQNIFRLLSLMDKGKLKQQINKMINDPTKKTDNDLQKLAKNALKKINKMEQYIDKIKNGVLVEMLNDVIQQINNINTQKILNAIINKHNIVDDVFDNRIPPINFDPSTGPSLLECKDVTYYSSTGTEYNCPKDKNIINFRNKASDNVETYKAPLVKKKYPIKPHIWDIHLIQQHAKNTVLQDARNNGQINSYAKRHAIHLNMNKKYNVVRDNIVHHILDNIFKNYVKYCINKVANNFVTSEIKGTKFQKHLSDFVNAVDAPFKLNMNEIYKDVKEECANLSIKYDKLFKSTLIMQNKGDKRVNTKDHYVYTINYDEDSVTYNRKCYDFDIRILKLLIKNHADVNKKDTSLNTPIYYAINMQHVGAVKYLKENGAKIIGTKNKLEQTPLDYAYHLFKTHNNVFYSNNSSNVLRKISKSYYEQVKKAIDMQERFKNNYLQYMDIIFPMFITMYNQQLYHKLANYQKGWTYEDNQKLINLFNKYNIFLLNTPLPFIDVRDNTVGEHGKNAHILKHVKDQNDGTDKQIKELENIVANLQKEFDGGNAMVQNRLVDYQKQLRNKKKKIISNSISKLTITSNLNVISNRNHKKILEYADKYNKSNYDKYKIMPSQFYNKIYKDSKVDWRTYLQLWHNYVENKKQQLDTIDNIYIMLNKLCNNKLKYNEYNFLKKVYNVIVIDNDKLGKNIDKNKDLNEFVNICAHVIHHTITQPFYYTLVKLFYKHVENTGVNKDSINGHVDRIIFDKTHGTSIYKWFNNKSFTFEKEMIKILLNFKENDDPVGMRSFHDHFDQIKEMIMENGILALSEDSELFKYIKNIILPYYENTLYKNIIPYMHKLFITHNRYIYMDQKHINILTTLLPK